MGLLKVGTPLDWKSTVDHSRYIREHGVRQFLSTWARVKDLQNDRLFYGDEVEYGLLKVDSERKEVRISLKGAEVLETLRAREGNTDKEGSRGCAWHQEYGSWMLEGTPNTPYGGYTSSLLQVERNMRLRRARVLSALASDEIAPTMVCFPLMGIGDFVHPPSVSGGPASLSETVPDACINPHPRFGTLTTNIRSRRGGKVDIRVPVFKDEQTPPDAPPIAMDCMAYGMGCCCLQVTFQASDVYESRYLYDQLAVLAPIMLALTAATPILHGRLADTDVRWHVIASSVDDRTPAERGEPKVAAPDPRLAGGGVRPLSKSRYDSVSCYIHGAANSSEAAAAHFNDVPCEVDEEMERLLLKEGIDGPLSRHLAHLFVRDPLVVFAGSVEEVDDNTSIEHFENLNSTNWQTMRWKPPPPRSPSAPCAPHIGWRTEFRSMEVQITDFENAAYTAFIVLVTRVLLVFDLNFLMPLSKVDENMARAHNIDAVSACKFWFRTHVIPTEGCGCQVEPRTPAPDAGLTGDAYEEMTMAEIMNGKGDFPGLMPLIYAYLDHIQCDETSFHRIDQYLLFIKQRATGHLPTAATWMRRFVREHPKYKKDSVVSQTIAHDLVIACDEIGRGRRQCKDLVGDTYIKPVLPQDAYDAFLGSSSSQEARCHLLQKLKGRACNEDGPGSRPTAPLRKRSRQSERTA